MDFRKTEKDYILRLDRDEEVTESLVKFAKQQAIQSGFINAIGAVKEVTIGYFDLQKQEYIKKQLNGNYELVSLNGNLAYINNEPFWHVHIVLADRDFRAIAGHLFEAKVAVTFEGFILTETKKINRKWDENTGLKLLNLS